MMIQRLAASVLCVAAVTAIAASVVVAGDGRGSRSKPYPVRTLVSLPESKGWKVRVNKSIPNATKLVLAENQFNAPPKRGRQFFMINITMVYAGKGSSTPFAGATFKAVGRSSVAYDFSDSCGVTPDDFDSFKKVFSGGRLTGNICFSVRSTDVASLLLLYEPFFSLGSSEVFFKLR
jgi:hypothetical protein